jgi:hypothetical protein
VTGLIVKGDAAVFLEGSDPGPQDAVALVNRFRGGNSRSWATKLEALNLEHGVRPKPLKRASLAWAYVFTVLTEGENGRLEPGPFDDELTCVVRDIETEGRRPSMCAIRSKLAADYESALAAYHEAVEKRSHLRGTEYERAEIVAEQRRVHLEQASKLLAEHEREHLCRNDEEEV